MEPHLSKKLRSNCLLIFDVLKHNENYIIKKKEFLTRKYDTDMLCVEQKKCMLPSSKALLKPLSSHKKVYSFNDEEVHQQKHNTKQGKIAYSINLSLSIYR